MPPRLATALPDKEVVAILTWSRYVDRRGMAMGSGASDLLTTTARPLPSRSLGSDTETEPEPEMDVVALMNAGSGCLMSPAQTQSERAVGPAPSHSRPGRLRSLPPGTRRSRRQLLSDSVDGAGGLDLGDSSDEAGVERARGASSTVAGAVTVAGNAFSDRDSDDVRAVGTGDDSKPRQSKAGSLPTVTFDGPATSEYHSSVSAASGSSVVGDDQAGGGATGAVESTFRASQRSHQYSTAAVVPAETVRVFVLGCVLHPDCCGGTTPALTRWPTRADFK
jgi:hypothetical protein